MAADPPTPDAAIFPIAHAAATAIHPVPVAMEPQGFRVLVMRELQLEEGAPPAFALMDQGLLRLPHRINRNSLFFANTFRPEIFDWLIAELGRPSQRDGEGRAARNPRWPTLAWHRAVRDWPEGAASVEWSVTVHFPEAASWDAFRERWQARLDGRSATLDAPSGAAEGQGGGA